MSEQRSLRNNSRTTGLSNRCLGNMAVGETGASTLKVIIIVVGSIIALAVIGFIVLVANEMARPGEETAPDSGSGVAPAESEPAAVKPGMALFDESGYGFTINYPEHWVYEKAGNTVIFSGPEGTDEYYTTANIQTLFSREVGGNYDDLNSLYRELRGQLESVGGQINNYKEELVDEDGETRTLISFDTSYLMNDEDYWQWILIFERDSDTFYQISYTAPVHLADLSSDTFFIDMMSSFNLVEF